MDERDLEAEQPGVRLDIDELRALRSRLTNQPAPGAQPPRPDPDLPLLRIKGVAFMGGFTIATRLPGESARDARKRVKREKREQHDREREEFPHGVSSNGRGGRTNPEDTRSVTALVQGLGGIDDLPAEAGQVVDRSPGTNEIAAGGVVGLGIGIAASSVAREVGRRGTRPGIGGIRAIGTGVAASTFERLNGLPARSDHLLCMAQQGLGRLILRAVMLGLVGATLWATRRGARLETARR